MRTIIGLSALCAAWACTAADAPVEHAHVSVASYGATWTDLDQIDISPEGGFTVDSDLGYRVHVDRGYLVHYSASLVPCEEHDHALAAGGALVTKSHGEESDPSMLAPPRVEPLVPPGTVELGEVEFPEAEYCGVHHLLARGSIDTLRDPDEMSMIGRSIYLEGSYLAPGGGAPVAFMIDGDTANAVLEDFADVQLTALADPDRGNRIEVRIERALGTLFDGVDFQAMSSDDMASRVLSNLVDHTWITANLVLPDE